MNFVRGVTGLFRRGSVAQGGRTDNITTSDSESQSRRDTLSLPPQPWPDLQFSKHGAEKKLESLWKSYQEASSQDETQKALENFLVMFNQCFKSWRPISTIGVIQTLVDDRNHEGCGNVDEPGEGSFQTEGCFLGHPTRVVVGLVQELKVMVKAMAEMHSSLEKNPVPIWKELELGMWILKALAIITRSSHNRMIFSFFGGLQILMAVMKAAVVNLKTVATFITSDLEPVSSSAVLTFLLNMLMCIECIAFSFIGAEVSSPEISVSVTHIQPSQISDPDSEILGLEYGSFSHSSTSALGTSLQRKSSTRGDGTGCIKASLPLFETGGLNWFVELLRILRRLHLKGALSDLLLEQLTLCTLNKAIESNSRTQNHFRSIGGLDVLLEGLGTTIGMGMDKVLAMFSRNQVDICGVLDLQVLSIEVIRAAVYRNTTSLQYVRDIAGLEKLAATIQWAAFSLPELESRESFCLDSGTDVSSTDKSACILAMSDMSELLKIKHCLLHNLEASERSAEFGTMEGLNLQVIRLCRTLCSLLFPGGDISHFGELPPSKIAAGISETYWELAIRSIVGVLILVFKSHGSLEKSTGNRRKPRVTTKSLQHHILHILKELLAISPSMLQLFRDEGVWGLMFSQYFFYFEAGLKEASSPKEHGDFFARVPKLESPKEKEDFFAALAVHAEPLQLEVISVLELAATTYGCTDNLLECSALIQAVENCQKYPTIVTMLVKSLHRILQLAPEQTTVSFHTLDILSRFSDLPVLKNSISTILPGEGMLFCSTEHMDSSDSVTPRELSLQAMAALFGLLDEYLLSSEQAEVDALHNSKVLHRLLSLLRDESTRGFALHHILSLLKLPCDVDGKRDAQSKLCTKYLETLSEIHSETCEGGCNAILNMLSGIQDLLKEDHKYYQVLFQEGECFVHIVSLLNKNNTEVAGADLSLVVLQTLRHLLLRNEASKLAFRELVGPGYRTLETMLRNHFGHPSRVLLYSVLDIVVEEDFNVHTSMEVENEDAVILFFKLLQQCTGSLVLEGLEIFEKILEDSTANQMLCAKSGLLGLLLDWVLETQDLGLATKLADLIRICGSHSICGTEMRKIYLILRSMKNGFKLEFGKLLLNSFKRMLANEGPAAFFELNGRNSGIVVTTPIRFPNKGFTFTCWARVECFSESRHHESAVMELFSFLTESGKGFTALIGENQMVFECITHKRQSAGVAIKLRSKHWHFLSITHTSGHTLSSTSDLSVFVDGHLTGSEKLRYPKVSELLQCKIAADDPHVIIADSTAQGFSGKCTTPFRGQLGPLYFFNEALSPDQIHSLFLLGPKYMYSFLSNEVGYYPERYAMKNIIDPKDGLASKVIFGYNAQASSGRCLYDVSPASEHMAGKESHEATILEGTKLCYRHLAQESINSVGGIAVFFPLIAHSEYLSWSNFCSIYDHDTVNQVDLQDSHHLNQSMLLNVIDDNIAVNVIEVIRATLAGNFSNQQFMHDSSGISILSYLLKSFPHEQLTVGVVSALDALLNSLAMTNGITLSKVLAAEIISKIYLDMRIWIRTLYIVQREVLMSLLNYSKKNSSEVHTVCGLSKVIDLMHQFYWDNPSSYKTCASRLAWDQVKRSSTEGGLTRHEVTHLRSLILAIAKEVLRDGISLSELKVFVFFLETSEDDICVEDVLRVIIELLSSVPFLATFSDHVHCYGGCQIFLGLLIRQSDALNLLGLRLLSALLISPPTEKKATRMFNLPGTGPRLSTEMQQAEKVKSSSLWTALSEKVLALRFTAPLCSTLFDILLGGALLSEVHGGISFEIAHDGERCGFKSLSRTQIIVPHMLGIIFKFFLTCDNLSFRTSVLRCILELFEKNPSNTEILVQEVVWQDWFFLAMVSGLKRKKLCSEDSSTENFRLFSAEELYIKKILTIIHTHCICNLKGGWQHLERTINYIYMYSEQGLLSRFDLLCSILSDLIEEILRISPFQSALTAQPCRDNLLYIISVIDELSVKDTFEFLPFPGDAFMDESVDNNSLSGGYVDMGFLTRGSGDDSEISPGNDDRGRRISSLIPGQALGTTLEGKTKSTDGTCWRLYDSLWRLLTALYSAGAGTAVSITGPSLGQRAWGLVESLNVPATEMAAVVSGGLGSVVGINLPIRIVDKAMKLRAEKCPRVVFRLVLLYLYKADLHAASHCVQLFISILPAILSSENEVMKNRLHLFLWSLLDARAQVGSQDDGARFHIISQLVREILDQAKGTLTSSLADKDKGRAGVISEETASVHSLLQQDRVLSAVRDEAKRLKMSLNLRAKEVESLEKELNTLSIASLQQGRILEDQAKAILRSLQNSELLRLTAYHLICDEEDQATANHWRHILRNLTDERGPWSPLPFPNDSLKWWKLDKTEDPSRRHIKLKRNYHINNDVLCQRTSGTAEVSDNSCEQTCVEIPEAIDIIHDPTTPLVMRGTRRKAPYVESEPTADEIPDLQDAVSLGAFPIFSAAKETCLEPYQSIFSETINIDEHGPTINRLVDAAEDEVIMAVSCVLVVPRRKIAGRLEITQTSLHFYGEFVLEGSAVSCVFSSSSDYSSYRDGRDKGFGEEVSMKGEMESVSICKHAGESNKDRGLFSKAGRSGLGQSINRHKRWNISQITTIHETRYLLQHTAIEIHFSCSIPPVFFNFESHKCAKDVATKVALQSSESNPGKSSMKGKEDAVLLVNRRKACDLADKARERWRRRELNNFDYLMTLNTLAGRSYNDLTQYPIFPWVLADYSSEKLDFTKPSTYRDLSKPVGALDEKRFKVFEERYHNFTDPDIPSFFYGSHYSSMGIVLYYLLRLEPFTSLHQGLQGGKFDHADRLFHSIAGAYANCLSNTSDVKELIPEFFYMPEFLTNDNNYAFGVKQDGERIGDVVLPLWAKGSSEEFIRRHREALESEYVSENLNHWIDLIFGYKQRGRPAVEAANVFYHLTYEGAVDLDTISDPVQRASVEDQIASFGQTPMQLFRKKHAKRGPPIPASHPLYYAPASITLTSCINLSTLYHGSVPSGQVCPLLFVGLVDGKVVTVSRGQIVGARLWLTPPLQGGGNLTFSSSQDPFFGVGPVILSPCRIPGAFAENLDLNSRCFELLQVQSSCFLLTCGHWDHSFKVISLSDGHLIQSNLQHKDVITCIAATSDGSVVVTGSKDTTVMVWDVKPSGSNFGKKRQGDVQDSTGRIINQHLVLSDKPRHILCGHDDTVTCVTVRVELDLVISGSRDASCIFYTLQEGRYVRSLRHPKGNTISKLAISQHGRVVLYSADDLCIRLCSVNGKWLACAETNGRLNCMQISGCGDYLVYGGDQGQVFVRTMHSLDTLRRYDGTGVAITSLFVTPEDCFLVGTQDGSLLVYSIELYPHRKHSMLQSVRSQSVLAGS